MKKRCCVFTFVKNEKIFLPIWLKYYSRYFDKNDIYVLDHDSDDRSVEECSKYYGFKVVKLHHKYFDSKWKTKLARYKQAELLQSYEYVLYADADEIIIPNPAEYEDLDGYLNRLDKDYVICTSLCLIHLKESEAPIDLSRSILEQRKYCYSDGFYDKPVLAKIPLNWQPGFHSAGLGNSRPDKDLWLLHLHKMNYDITWA